MGRGQGGELWFLWKMNKKFKIKTLKISVREGIDKSVFSL